MYGAIIAQHPNSIAVLVWLLGALLVTDIGHIWRVLEWYLRGRATSSWTNSSYAWYYPSGQWSWCCTNWEWCWDSSTGHNMPAKTGSGMFPISTFAFPVAVKSDGGWHLWLHMWWHDGWLVRMGNWNKTRSKPLETLTCSVAKEACRGFQIALEASIVCNETEKGVGMIHELLTISFVNNLYDLAGMEYIKTLGCVVFHNDKLRHNWVIATQASKVLVQECDYKEGPADYKRRSCCNLFHKTLRFRIGAQSWYKQRLSPASDSSLSDNAVVAHTLWLSRSTHKSHTQKTSQSW